MEPSIFADAKDCAVFSKALIGLSALAISLIVYLSKPRGLPRIKSLSGETCWARRISSSESAWFPLFVVVSFVEIKIPFLSVINSFFFPFFERYREQRPRNKFYYSYILPLV